LAKGKAKLFKRFWIFLVFCGLLIALTTSTLGSQRFSSFVEQKVIRLTRDAGVPLSMQGFRLGFPSIKAKLVNSTLQLRPIPVALSLENVSLQPGYFSLFSEPHSLALQGELYSGRLQTNLSLAPSTATIQLRGKLEEFALNAHPQLAGLGIKSGTLSLSSNDLVLSRGNTPLGELQVSLGKLATFGETTLQPGVTRLPLPLVIPEIKDGNLAASLSMKDDRVSISKIEFESSWGSLKGSGDLALDGHRKVRAFSLRLTLNLSREGQKHFGSYLPLITSNKIKSDERQFTLTVAGFPLKVLRVD
jgi:type II secretion system protein N